MVRAALDVHAVAAVRPDRRRHPDSRVAVDEVTALLDVELDVDAHVAQQVRRPALDDVAERHAVTVAQLARVVPGEPPRGEPGSQAGKGKPRPFLLGEHSDAQGSRRLEPALPEHVDGGQGAHDTERTVVRPTVPHRVQVATGQD